MSSAPHVKQETFFWGSLFGRNIPLNRPTVLFCPSLACVGLLAPTSTFAFDVVVVLCFNGGLCGLSADTVLRRTIVGGDCESRCCLDVALSVSRRSCSASRPAVEGLRLVGSVFLRSGNCRLAVECTRPLTGVLGCDFVADFADVSRRIFSGLP